MNCWLDAVQGQIPNMNNYSKILLNFAFTNELNYLQTYITVYSCVENSLNCNIYAENFAVSAHMLAEMRSITIIIGYGPFALR